MIAHGRHTCGFVLVASDVVCVLSGFCDRCEEILCHYAHSGARGETVNSEAELGKEIRRVQGPFGVSSGSCMMQWRSLRLWHA